MCGIFGLIGNYSTAPTDVFKGLIDIEYRGYDSWGLAYPIDNQLAVIKDIGFLPKTLKLPVSNLAVGHTRWATHGGVTKVNAHPHTDCNQQIGLVHNGIVENYLNLKSALKQHKFKSETDSEVIAHLIEAELKKTTNLSNAVGAVFKKLQGLNAIVVTDGKQIVACKKGSALVIGKTLHGFCIASDPNALLPLTNQLIFLEDNQLVSLSENFEIFNVLNMQSLAVDFQKVDWTYSRVKLNKFPHFMLKEIYEQPQVIRNILSNLDEIKKVAELIDKAYGTYFVGCGSASYACLSGTYLFSKYAKRHVNFSLGSEFNYILDFLTPKSLLIAVSQSGETIDTVEPVQGAKAKGAKVVAMTNVLGSSLFRLSDYPLLLQAGVEKGVASTKAYIAMLSIMLMLACAAGNNLKQGEKILRNSIKELENILKRKTKIKKLADMISSAKNIYVIGRGLSYPLALEAALKIKEISYIHAEGLAGGELKHGPIALVEPGSPIIVFVPNDETKEAILANAMEVKARGAFVIGVGFEENPVFDFWFEVKDVGASSIIPHVAFAQLLGYFLALKLKRNPDKPRNLAKSVVVR